MGSIIDASVRISHRPVDSPRSLKVIVVGAGVSGILAAIKLQNSVKSLDLVIYDKNEELGGTWFENKYPGCACDIPAHCYQLSFDSNHAWTQFYASAPEILEYWKRVADKYDVRKFMKLSHSVKDATWHEETAKWNITIENAATQGVVHDSADILITGIGVLNKWDWPAIPGLRDFKGDLMHSADWNTTFDHRDKRIAIVGAGSSGIQIVPSLQPAAKRIDHYVRGKTWIATPLAAHELEKRNVKTGNFNFGLDEIKAWEQDPQLYLTYRKELEQVLQTDHSVTMRGSVSQKQARAYFQILMSQRLQKKPEILSHMLPDFPPLCKRLTPGPGYLEALTEDNVDVIPAPIAEVTEEGIRTVDGKFRQVDAIVCATGFDVSYTNRFPIYGQHDVLLGDKFRLQKAASYASITTDGFPNLFMMLGPNSGLGTGNLLIILERIADYIAQCLEKMQHQEILTMQPSVAAVHSFTSYCDTYFQGTVYSEECSSWYKSGGSNGRVTALWPGSSLHAIRALEKPRWEDFEYTYVNGNRMGWLGDGSSERDDSDLDKAYYLTSQSLLKDPLPMVNGVKK